LIVQAPEDGEVWAEALPFARINLAFAGSLLSTWLNTGALIVADKSA
jgi:hypothetical protein